MEKKYRSMTIDKAHNYDGKNIVEDIHEENMHADEIL